MSDEHTPTTKNVRLHYAAAGGDLIPERGAEFDRWLAANNAEVRNDATEHAREAWVATLLAHTNLSADEIGTALGYLSEGYMRTRKDPP